MSEKFSPGDVGGEAPGSSKVKAALEDVRVCLDGADDKGYAGGIQEELEHVGWFLDGVEMDNGEERGPGDHEG